MTNEQRIESALSANTFLLRWRCEGAVDAAEFEALRELLHALKRQWSHQENVSKSLAGLLCEMAVIARNFDFDLSNDDAQIYSAQEEMRAMLLELDALIFDCYDQAQPSDDIALPFGE